MYITTITGLLQSQPSLGFMEPRAQYISRALQYLIMMYIFFKTLIYNLLLLLFI